VGNCVSDFHAPNIYANSQRFRKRHLKARGLFRSGKIPGFIHLYIGKEAGAAGAMATILAQAPIEDMDALF